MMVFMCVGWWRWRRSVGVVVHGAVVVAALGRRTQLGAAPAQVHAVRGAGAGAAARRGRLEQRLVEVRVVGMHVARVCRRRPQLLVAARVGRRQVAGVGVAELRQGGRALRLAAAALRAALRLALCAHTQNSLRLWTATRMIRQRAAGSPLPIGARVPVLLYWWRLMRTRCYAIRILRERILQLCGSRTNYRITNGILPNH